MVVRRRDILGWGRWIVLGTGLVFLSLLVAAAPRPGISRSRHLLVAGSTMAVIGDLIDLSKLAAIEAAQIALGNGPGHRRHRTVRLGRRARSRAPFAEVGDAGSAFIVAEAFDVAEEGVIFETVTWIASAIGVSWILLTLRLTDLSSAATARSPVHDRVIRLLARVVGRRVFPILPIPVRLRTVTLGAW